VRGDSWLAPDGRRATPQRVHARETEGRPPWRPAPERQAVRLRSAGCRRCVRTRSYSMHRGAHGHVRLRGSVNRMADSVPQRPAAAGARVGLGSTRHGTQPTRRRSARSASSIAWRVVDVIGRIARDTRILATLTEPLHLQETVGVYDRRIHAAAAVCTQFCARRHAACVGCAERNTMALRRGSGVCALREEEADGVAAVCAGPARQTRQSLEPRVHAMHIAEL
jgi:hypothetical protein